MQRSSLAKTLPADHPRSAPRMSLDVSEIVDGRYEVLGALGEGGMGVVFRARDVYLQRPVALKFQLHDSAKDDVRFLSEASALAALRHEHIPTLYAFGRHGGRVFFAMELIEGISLYDAARSAPDGRGSFPVERAVDILCKVSHAAAAAHASGIVHRDIKPENVMLEAGSGRPVLVDFGLAETDDATADKELIVGTPHYIADEILLGGAASPASDQHALGVIAYELLTGRTPYQDGKPGEIFEAQLAGPPPPPSARRPGIAAFDEVILRAMSARPEDRFSTCRAFSEALADAFQRHVAQAVRAASAVDETRETSHLGALKVLVVDDDPAFAALSARAARAATLGLDIAVRRVSSGQLALASAAQRMPTLVILDHHLQDTNGVELLAGLRRMRGGSALRAIVVTDSATEVAGWYRMLGVHSVLAKPAAFDTLVAAIHAIAKGEGWVPRAAAVPTPC